MNIIFSESFKKDYKKINKDLRIKILKQIKKLTQNPHVGKPLRKPLHGYRSIRIKPYRVLYTFSKDEIVIHIIEHRDHVYD